MRRFDIHVRNCVVATIAFACIGSTSGQVVSAQTVPKAEVTTADKEENCSALKPYRDLDQFGKSYFPESVYEEARTQTDYECRHIWYLSDEMPVSGYVIKPKAIKNRSWPVILYARGGTGNFGVIDDLTKADLYLLAKEGYVVLATDYRWIGDRARRDEWGGVDVNDLFNLVPVARKLPFADPQRIFMLGVSRGGMMVYLALKRGIPVKAAAVIAGPTDLEAMAVDRPEFVTGDAEYDGWAKVFPDFEHRKEEHLRVRSAVDWADQINVPVLILHSRADTKVPVSHALALAQKLQQYKKEYELVIYGRDGHSLPLNRTDRNQHIIGWFRAHDPSLRNGQ